jgi:membrane-associated phospholipid phosphatase
MKEQKDRQASEQLHQGAQQAVEGAKREVQRARVPWYRAIWRGELLLVVDAIVLALFGLLAWWVHVHPILSVDIAITREFQENHTFWLQTLMLAVSVPGTYWEVQTAFVALAALIFWLLDMRLEALFILGLSAVSALLDLVIKLVVARPRPTARLVDVIQYARGLSFPSGHVMSYVALWGLLFSFGIILFRGNHWWRSALLIVSALFVVLVGPSRIYLGDHWASDVLGAYLIGGVLLGLALFLFLKLKALGILEPRRQRGHWYRYTRRKATS